MAAACRDAGRLARLMCLTEIEARATLAVAEHGELTLPALAAELDLSRGGAAALAERLVREAVARCVPDARCPHRAALVLSEGAALEVAVAGA